MSTVRISRKYAEALIDALDGVSLQPIAALALEALTRGLEPKTVKPIARVERRRKEAKRATKKEQTAAIRAAVMQRAFGMCEACKEARAKDLDHMFGRVRVRQSERNCWALCAECHLDKTLNSPTASHWLGRFAEHARGHGFIAEASMAERRAEALELSRGQAVAP